MDVTQLPFNALIGLELMPPESGFLVGLPEGAQFTNHLGTVHASALVAVAEAGSGAFLVRLFGDVFGVVPVVRQLDAKFRRPATGRVMARANVDADLGKKWMTDVAERGRTLATVPIEVVDAAGDVVFSASIQWFIARAK